jgi:hypothetical protein
VADALREKVISLGSMDRGLRVMTLVALAVVLCCALLLGIRDLPLPSVPVAGGGGGSGVTISVAVAAACGVLSVLAWSFVLVGMLHAHMAMRLAALVIYTVLLALWASWNGTVPGAIVAGLLLAPAWAMAVTLWVVDHFHHSRHAPHRHHRHRLKIPTLLFFVPVTAVPIAVVAALGTTNGAFGSLLWLQFFVVQYLLFPMLFLAGTDFAEWSEVVGGRLSGWLARAGGERAAWILAGLTVALGLFLFFDNSPFELRPVLDARLLVVSAQQLPPLLLMVLLGWYALRMRAATEISFGALVAAALLGYAALIAPAVPSILGRGSGPPLDVGWAVVVPIVWIPAIVVAVLLMRRGGAAAGAGLFLGCAGIASLFLFGAPYWPAAILGQQPWLAGASLTNLTRVVGLAAACLAVFMGVTGRLGARQVALLRLVLTLLVGLIGLELLAIVVFGTVVDAAAQLSVTQALVLLIALMWDVLTSGEAITNRGGHHVPRHTRVLLYLGYIMMVAGWVLFANSMHGQSPWVLTPFDSEQLPRFGIEILGLPLLVTFFVVNLGAAFRRSAPS